MANYKIAWYDRKKQIIVINIIFFILGIFLGITEHNLAFGIAIWFFGSWITETVVSTFSKSGDRLSSLGRSIWISLIAGFFSVSPSTSDLWVLVYFFALFKAMFGVIALAVILVFEFFAFPITTIYYYIKSRGNDTYSV